MAKEKTESAEKCDFVTENLQFIVKSEEIDKFLRFLFGKFVVLLYLCTAILRKRHKLIV